jgi:hypothetical protein
MRAEGVTQGMHPGFSDPCLGVVLFDEFADTTGIQRRAVSGKKERLLINDVVLPVAVCQIPPQCPFQLWHQGNGSLLTIPYRDFSEYACRLAGDTS